MIVKESEMKFTPAPAGTHVARCFSVIDIGTQAGSFNGKPTMKRKVRIVWELCNEKMDDGKPLIISKTYTATLTENSALRDDLQSWRGKPFTSEELAGFELKNILGAACMITVIHEPRKDGKSGVYDNIKSVSALPKGLTATAVVNEKVSFCIVGPNGEDTFEKAIYDKFPDWLKKKICDSPEGKKKIGGFTPQSQSAANPNGITAGEAAGEIPF